MATIHLIRHGQARFGEDVYDELSPKGIEQARITGAALSLGGIEVGLVVYGSLKRHRQTAEAALSAMGCSPQLVVDSDWDEFDHLGVIAAYRPDYADPSRLREEMLKAPNPHYAFQALFEEALMRWVSGEHDADYTESWTAFCARCRRALEKLQDAMATASSDVLVFTSGGPITAVAKALLDLSDHRATGLNWTLVNCGITKLISGKRGIRLSTLNCHAHFEGIKANLLTYR